MDAPSIGFSWFEWHFHPDVIIGVLFLETLYCLVVGPIRKRLRWGDPVEPRKIAWFTAGMIVIYVALTSAIHELSESYLFSAHMIQHLLLIVIAPPMLVAGSPSWILRPIQSYWRLLAVARFITRPLVAFFIFSVVLSVWHIPYLYDLTLHSRAPHVLEHLLFISSSVIMWLPVMSSMPEIPRATHPVQILYLFGLSLPMGMIGAAITFSPNILYSWYATVPRLWGLSVLEDQQIGGLIMKLLGGAAFLVVTAVIFFIWFAKDEKGEIVTGRAEFLSPEE